MSANPGRVDLDADNGTGTSCKRPVLAVGSCFQCFRLRKEFAHDYMTRAKMSRLLASTRRRRIYEEQLFL